MGLIISSSEGPEAPFRFAHEIVRQTLLADTSLPRRQRLHLRVADALERIDASVINDRVAEIALHLVRAGSAADRQRTRDFLILAGRVAVEAGGYETALIHFESALSRIDETIRTSERNCSIAWRLRNAVWADGITRTFAGRRRLASLPPRMTARPSPRSVSESLKVSPGPAVGEKPGKSRRVA